MKDLKAHNNQISIEKTPKKVSPLPHQTIIFTPPIKIPFKMLKNLIILIMILKFHKIFLRLLKKLLKIKSKMD